MTRQWGYVFTVWVWVSGGFVILLILLAWARYLRKWWLRELAIREMKIRELEDGDANGEDKH